ncbi:MAG: septum formation initiator family protein [Gammaproteobacteria bacterium]|nr:septum formation initiator family protein [Gammaproteobacteria bacterium]
MSRTVPVLVLSGLLLALQSRLWFGDGGVLVNHRLQQAVERQLQDNVRAAQRNAAIQADVDDLKHGGESIEARARSELGMVRQGETFYLVVNAD